ncbi:VOC family protein [Actinomycetes bacterium KLBMP 9797]
MTRTSAQAQVEVAVDPATAFRAFTDEIDRWWVPGPINNWDSSRALGRRIEPGVGGRILEVYDEASADVLELGRITVWEPGARLVYRSSIDDTEVEVRFAPTPAGTLVRVDHRLLPGGDADRAAFFWPNVIHWLASWCRDRDTAPAQPRRLAPLSVGLYYADPPAAARWLHRVFGLTSWDRVPAEGERPEWIELHVGNVAVLLFPLAKDEENANGAVTHTVWVYVDDLAEHLARAEAGGATIVSGIQEHGYRSYVAADLAGHHWTFVQRMPTTS